MYPTFAKLAEDGITAVIPSSASFANVGYIKDVVVFDVNWNITSLTVRHQQIGIAEDCPSIELNDQFLETVE